MNARKPPRWVFAAAIGAGALGWAQLALRPALHDISLKKAQLLATRNEIVRGENFTRGLEDLARYLDEFASAIDELDRLVPKQADANARVQEVSAIADRVGLSLTLVRPDPPLPRNGITSHPLVIKLHGSYLALERFLYEAEAQERHSRVTHCKIERSQGDAAGATVNAEVELTAFSLSPSGAGA